MYKDRQETHHLAYSAVTKLQDKPIQFNTNFKFKPHDLPEKHTHRSRFAGGQKTDNNADLAFLRNTVGPSSLNSANLLNIHHSDGKKIDSSLRQTMNVSSNVKDLFKSSYQPSQNRLSRTETSNPNGNSNKNNNSSPNQNDRLQRIMNKFDKQKQTKQALKLLQELKQLKRKQQQLKKQRKQESIKQSDDLKQGLSISVSSEQMSKSPPISYDLQSPVNFTKKNRIDYSTPTYGNKSQSTYPRSPQEMSFQRHKKSSLDFTNDNTYLLHSNPNQSYHRSSYKQPHLQHNTHTLLTQNLSKSSASLKPYYEHGANSTETSSKNSSSFAKLSTKEYLSTTESKFDKDYRPTTSYKIPDQSERNYWNVNKEKDQYHTNYSKSPNHSKYSNKDQITTSIYNNNKYDTYSSNLTYSNTPLRNVFSNRKVTINDFHLGKNLGEGKFGTVYQAFDKKTKTIYALKKIPKSVIKSHWMIDQFILQVKLQQFCNHPNILSLHGCFDDSQNVYILLQYMEGGTLFLHLKKNTTLGEKQAAIRVKEMASAIQYLHENGIAHRDLKPQNIVMSHGVCKLCDFGWATLCDERRKTYCGTFDYAAPEILQGEQYDMSVDLWCLGILAYEILVGKAPFYHISRKETMKKIMNCEHQKINYPSTMSYEARSFIQQLLKRNPDERLKSEDLLKHPFILMADK